MLRRPLSQLGRRNPYSPVSTSLDAFGISASVLSAPRIPFPPQHPHPSHVFWRIRPRLKSFNCCHHACSWSRFNRTRLCVILGILLFFASPCACINVSEADDKLPPEIPPSLWPSHRRGSSYRRTRRLPSS